MEKVIEVSNVRKKYALYNRKIDKVREAFSVRRRKYHDDFEALKGISFSVNKGECVGIIGLNGSGKSTLLKILADVIKPTQGQINVRGTVSALLELGAGFNPEYTGMENIYLTTMLMGFSRSETDSKLQDILEFADIGRFIDQPVKNYSSGMFVRLAFSIAIAVEPDILLIDEALSVGDVFFQQKCYNKIREFAQKSTVIIVSHDLNAITKFCQRVILLNQGILIYDGEPRSGVTEYYKIKQGEINNRITQSSTFVIDRSKYRVPTAENYSGHMDVMITGYYYQIGNAPFETYCEAGNKIVFQILVKSNRKIENVIIGDINELSKNEISDIMYQFLESC